MITKNVIDSIHVTQLLIIAFNIFFSHSLWHIAHRPKENVVLSEDQKAEKKRIFLHVVGASVCLMMPARCDDDVYFNKCFQLYKKCCRWCFFGQKWICHWANRNDKRRDKVKDFWFLFCNTLNNSAKVNLRKKKLKYF